MFRISQQQRFYRTVGSWHLLLGCHRPRVVTQVGFKIDALSSTSDWLIFKKRRFDWLKASFSQPHIENPSQQWHAPSRRTIEGRGLLFELYIRQSHSISGLTRIVILTLESQSVRGTSSGTLESQNSLTFWSCDGVVTQAGF